MEARPLILDSEYDKSTLAAQVDGVGSPLRRVSYHIAEESVHSGDDIPAMGARASQCSRCTLDVVGLVLPCRDPLIMIGVLFSL